MLEIVPGYGFLYKFLLFILKSALISGKRKNILYEKEERKYLLMEIKMNKEELAKRIKGRVAMIGTALKHMESIMKYNQNAYCGDNSIGTVSMGNGIFVIRDGAFADCKNLKAVDMGDNVIEIDSSAFSGCKKLEAVYLSKNLRDINMNAFRDCSALEYMYLPENLTSIAAGAFANCTSLEKVVIPESVNYLGIGAFADCKNLKEIDIPDALLAKMERDPVANIANVFKGT